MTRKYLHIFSFQAAFGHVIFHDRFYDVLFLISGELENSGGSQGFGDGESPFPASSRW